jgi:hypothetical protein
VLLVAKTPEAWKTMRAAFSESGGVDKRYVALVRGPLADEGEIELPLVHAGDHVRPAIEGEEARPAKSAFRVLRRKGVMSLVEVRLFTGVLHQVRAHLSAIGAPIVGDTRYAGRAEPGLSRFFLHAASLDLHAPRDGGDDEGREPVAAGAGARARAPSARPLSTATHKRVIESRSRRHGGKAADRRRAGGTPQGANAATGDAFGRESITFLWGAVRRAHPLTPVRGQRSAKCVKPSDFPAKA